jgi:hypothetical protein
MDPSMDAAHRGATALSEPAHDAVQARGNVPADDPASVHRAAAAGVSGAGSALPYFDQIQGAFGDAHDLSQVRAHVGGDADAASEQMGAEAYATGDHIAFRGQPDLHTAAHEAAHVVQQRAGVQLSGGVGQAGDAYERQADAVADAVVGGHSAADVLGSASSGQGSGPATQALQMNAAGGGGTGAIEELDRVSRGNWIGNVAEGQALGILRRMLPAERTTLAQTRNHDATIRRLCDAFDVGEMLQMLSLIPYQLRWRIYWLEVAGVIDELDTDNWRWVFAYAPPEQVAALRNYPTGYRLFLEHAPANMVPAWDRLQGLENGQWNGNAQAIRNAVNALAPDQRQTVRDDHPKMRIIMQRCGDTNDKFRVITYLDPPLKWAVYWLNQGRALDGLSDTQWAQLMAEAPRAEQDELAGWNEMWQLAQRHCPASILQVTRQNSDAAAASTALSDPVQVATLLASLGPAGFLATATQGPAPLIQTNYANVKSAGKVNEVLDGLPRGARLGAQTEANHKAWFDHSGETDVPTLEKMVSIRFGVATTGAGSMPHTSGSSPANLQPWTADALRRCWTVLEGLPPEQVEGNTRLLHMLRNAGANNGNAYFWGDDVVMGYQNDAELTANVPGNQRVYTAGGRGPGTAAVPVNQFNATLRHEIGHAVDAQLGIMATWGRQNAAGGWTKYGSYSAFVDAIIAAAGGMSGHGYPDERLYKRAMVHAVTNTMRFTAALTALGGDAAAAAAFQSTGPVSVVWEPRNWTGGGSGPWYTNAWVTAGDRNFQRAYDDQRSLYSFLAAERTARMVTQYQWRAPGEWFAEVYQVYYAEQEQGSNVPVGGILRSRDSAAADMMSNLIDRGYSPQQVRGGGTVKAPGT